MWRGFLRASAPLPWATSYSVLRSLLELPSWAIPGLAIGHDDLLRGVLLLQLTGNRPLMRATGWLMSDGMNQASSVITNGAPPPISTAVHAVLTFCSTACSPPSHSPRARWRRAGAKSAGWEQASDMTLEGKKKLATTACAHDPPGRIKCRGCSKFEA